MELGDIGRMMADGHIEPAAKAPSIEGCVQLSIAISLKRIADALDSSDAGGRPQGSILYFLEMMASAANAGRS